jgi:hypothetical protein
MPALTRRRSSEHPSQQCWLIYYGDIHAGTISERSGNPHDTEPWEWQCGFYPGSRPGECTSGTTLAALQYFPIVSFNNERRNHTEHDQYPRDQTSILKESVDHEPLLYVQQAPQWGRHRLEILGLPPGTYLVPGGLTAPVLSLGGRSRFCAALVISRGRQPCF